MLLKSADKVYISVSAFIALDTGKCIPIALCPGQPLALTQWEKNKFLQEGD